MYVEEGKSEKQINNDHIHSLFIKWGKYFRII